MAMAVRAADDRATAYARSVVDGSETAGPLIRLACERHLADLERSDLFWDIEAAHRPIEFMEGCCVLHTGRFSGEPMLLQPCQDFIVGSAFGWKMPSLRCSEDDPSAWPRRFRRIFAEIGKGFGKTSLAAGVGLYLLGADGEDDAEIYAVASKRAQAKLVFKRACKFIRKNPDLGRHFRICGDVDQHMVLHARSGSEWKPLAHTAEDTDSGITAHAVIADELHEWKSGDLLEMMEMAFKIRVQPLIWIITNSGKSIVGPCWGEHCHAVDVLKGEVKDDRTFAYIGSLDDGEDPFEIPLENFRKANPMLGVTVPLDEVHDKREKAKRSPSARAAFLRFYCCEWVFGSSSFLDSRTVLDSVDDALDAEGLRGRRCIASIDLSETTDLCSCCLLADDSDPEGSDPEEMRFAAAWRNFTPAENLRERGIEDNLPYLDWVDQGWLTAAPGARIRYDWVVMQLMAWLQPYDVRMIVFDAWHWNQMLDAMDRAGWDVPMMQHPAGMRRLRDSGLWMPESVDCAEMLLTEGRIRIEPNPVAVQALLAVDVETHRSGLREPVKQRTRDRIDPAVTLIMAAGAAEQLPEICGADSGSGAAF